jgi:hypothetical protein
VPGSTVFSQTDAVHPLADVEHESAVRSAGADAGEPRCREPLAPRHSPRRTVSLRPYQSPSFRRCGNPAVLSRGRRARQRAWESQTDAS